MGAAGRREVRVLEVGIGWSPEVGSNGANVADGAGGGLSYAVGEKRFEGVEPIDERGSGEA